MSYTDPQIGTLTMSGDPARFVATERVPVSGVSMDFEPVQDLHGYEYPWPGGGGANKWDEEWEVGTILNGVNSPSEVSLRSKSYVPVVPGNNYNFVSDTTRVKYIYFYDSDKNVVSGEVISLVQKTFTFTPASGCYYLRFVIQYYIQDNGTYKNNIAINYPSTVKTYTPYKNICPITGRDSVTVYVSPVPSVVDGTEDYEIEFGQTVYAGTLTINEDGSGQIEITQEIITLDGDLLLYDVSAPTVTETYSQVAWTPYANIGVANANFMCDKFRSILPSETKRLYCIWGSSTAPRMFMSLPVTVTTREQAIAWFTENPVTVVYPLATPATIQLDPIEITTLIGLNYVWTSDHNLITISFPYNKEVQPMALNYDHCWTYPKAYIDKLEARIAALETAAAEAAEANTAAAPADTRETVAEEITVTEEPEPEPVTKKGGK